jgi:hypothetical protein
MVKNYSIKRKGGWQTHCCNTTTPHTFNENGKQITLKHGTDCTPSTTGFCTISSTSIPSKFRCNSEKRKYEMIDGKNGCWIVSDNSLTANIPVIGTIYNKLTLGGKRKTKKSRKSHRKTKKT